MKIKVINIKPDFVDERGSIIKIIDQEKYNIKSVLILERKKGSIGANHYHKKDYHFMYIEKGKVRYSEKNIKNSKSKIETVILNQGSLVLTKPYIIHTTEFLENTIMLAFSTQKRDRKNYEKDTIRFKLV